MGRLHVVGVVKATLTAGAAGAASTSTASPSSPSSSSSTAQAAAAAGSVAAGRTAGRAGRLTVALSCRGAHKYGWFVKLMLAFGQAVQQMGFLHGV